MLIDGILHAQRNEQLCETLLDFIQSHEVRKLHAFLSIKNNNEPDISSLFETLWSSKIDVIVSKTDFMFKQMRHYYYNKHTDLVENSKGIPEPNNAQEASLEDLDLILVPLLVSDKEGYRIGYGGGYYDRLLAETKALKVGLSLSPPVDKILQSEEWDVPLNYLITPNKIYNYG